MLDIIECLSDSDTWQLGTEDPPGAPSSPPPPKRQLTDDEKRRKTVLIVEDDPDVRNTVMDCLAEEHFGVVAVRNGVEAVYYLTHVPKLPDIILLDLMMPVMDGWELKKKLDKNPQWAEIPVVIYSANTRTRPVTAAVVLTKPVSLRMLVDALKAHLKPEE